MNWLDYRKNKGLDISQFDEDNALVPAEVMPGFEPESLVYENVPEFDEAFGVVPQTPIAKPDEVPVAWGAKPIPDIARPAEAAPSSKAAVDPLDAARAKDRRRQNEADVRMLILAGARRESPQLRNLGTPETDLARQKLALQPKQEDEISKQTRIAQLNKLLEKPKAKPEDEEMRQARLKMLLAQGNMYDRANQPKPPGPAKEPADPREREARIKIMEARVRALSAPKSPKKPGEGGKVLPTGALDMLSNYDTALEALDDMERDFKALNVGNLVDRAGNWVRESDAQTFEASMSPRRQVVGTIIEGGKLVGSDEPKYKEMMLKPGDGPRVVEAKIKSLRKLLTTWKDKRARAYSEGGYKVPASKPAAKPVTIRQKATGETVTIPADELPAWQAEDDWTDYEVAE